MVLHMLGMAYVLHVGRYADAHSAQPHMHRQLAAFHAGSNKRVAATTQFKAVNGSDGTVLPRGAASTHLGEYRQRHLHRICPVAAQLHTPQLLQRGQHDCAHQLAAGAAVAAAAATAGRHRGGGVQRHTAVPCTAPRLRGSYDTTSSAAAPADANRCAHPLGGPPPAQVVHACMPLTYFCAHQPTDRMPLPTYSPAAPGQW